MFRRPPPTTTTIQPPQVIGRCDGPQTATSDPHQQARCRVGGNPPRWPNEWRSAVWESPQNFGSWGSLLPLHGSALFSVPCWWRSGMAACDVQNLGVGGSPPPRTHLRLRDQQGGVGAIPPCAPDIEMAPPITVATSAAVALGSKCGARGPSRTTMRPRDTPSATANPGQLKVFATRMRFHRNYPPSRGSRYRRSAPQMPRRRGNSPRPILVGGIIEGSIFAKCELGIKGTWILVGFLKMVAYFCSPALAPPWGGLAALYFRCFGASGPGWVPV